MLASLSHTLERLGVVRGGLPASYADGAAVPTTIPVPSIPRPTARPSAPSQQPTPAGHEPGLMEDLLGLELNTENVETVLDEMVRPALNADGGDITLVRISGGDIHVKLVGACNTCPSSVMTMKMGVERLLQDEFPDMGELIQVDAPEDLMGW